MKTVAGITTLCIGLILFSCSKNADSIVVQRKKIVEAVYASGTMHPLNEYKAYANATGILRNLRLREGDSVAAGQELFQIESRDPDLRVQSAQEALQYARSLADPHSSTIDELVANCDAARAKLMGDSLNLSRMKALHASGSATTSDLDRAQSTFDQSRAQLSSAMRRLENTKLSLRNQVLLAQKQLELARTSSENFSVRSRCDGKVFALYREEGETVNSQQPVALVGDAKDFLLRLVIDASDVVRVQPGQKVMYTVDAFPDSTFSATVVKTFPVLENETQSFRVDARCDQTPAVPFVGTQIQANIIVSQKQNALVIPRSCLQSNNQVFVKEGSSIKTVDVQVGISNLEYVEIVSGLSEGAQIVRRK